MCHSIFEYVLPTCFLHSAKSWYVSYHALIIWYYEQIHLVKCVVLENSHVRVHSALRQFSCSWMQEASDTLEPYGIQCCSSIVYEKDVLEHSFTILTVEFWHSIPPTRQH